MDATTLDVMPMEVTTSAPETTLPVEQQAGSTTPDRVFTPPDRQGTTDSGSMATLATPPPEAYNSLNYNFNHQLPTPAPFYRPDDILAHLATTENNIPDTPAIDPEQNYFRVYAALTLEEFQLLSQQQTTPIPELSYNLPVHDLPSDLRMPHYDSLPLHLRLSEAVNFYYYNLTSLHLTTQYTNSMVIIQLHIPPEVLLRFVSAGQLVNFCRDYVSHMISIKDEHHLPTRQLHQRLHRITYNLDQITTTFNLSNNFIWNYHMPLYLPELLNYFDQPQQVQDHHYKSINTMLHKSATYYGITLLTATNLSMQHKQLPHYHRPSTCTAGMRLQPPSWRSRLPQHIHYQPLIMQAWTTASAKSRTTESNTGLSTPDLQVELQLRAVLRHRTTR